MVKRRMLRKSSRRSRGGEVDEDRYAKDYNGIMEPGPEKKEPYMKGYRLVKYPETSKTEIGMQIAKKYKNEIDDYDSIGHPKGYDVSKTIPQPSPPDSKRGSWSATKKQEKGGKRHRKSRKTRKLRK